MFINKIISNKTSWKWLLILVTVYYLLTIAVDYVTFHFIGFGELSTSELLLDVELEDIEGSYSQFGLFHYVLPLLFLLIKTICITVCVYVGNVILKFNKLSFIQWWLVVVMAQSIPILYTFIDCVIQFFVGTNNLFDLRYDMSLARIFEGNVSDTIGDIITPVLSAINFIEILFWMALSYVISIVSKIKYIQSLKFVAITYGLGFMLYLIVVMLFTVVY